MLTQCLIARFTMVGQSSRMGRNVTKEVKVHHPFILGTAVLALTVCSGLGEANAASRSAQTYSARTNYNPQYYGYPRPGCTFAIREYQRRWPYQLWPPSMRCGPYY
jgi:hypothetical protein